MYAIQLFWAFAYFVACCNCNGLSVFGPKKIRPNSNFTIVLTNSLNKHIQLEAILENSNDPSMLREIKTFIVRSRSSREIPFNVDSIESCNWCYQLAVNSLDRTFSFNQIAELEYDVKTTSTFIQTDKPVYNPGEKLRFRVVVVDIYTRPATSIETVHVSIKNPDDESIREWPFARLYKGVYESSVQLPPSSALGKWTLAVTGNGIQKHKYFEVKQYVLPKFFVKVHLTEIALVQDMAISIMLETAYTFGHPVEGHYKAELFLDDTVKQPSFIKKGKINGKTSFDFHLEEQVDVDIESEFSNVTLKVAVLDEFSNHTVSITEQIPIYKKPCSVNIFSKPTFTPGFLYDGTLDIKDHFGRPLGKHKSRNAAITADIHTSSGDDTTTVNVKLDENGLGQFELKPPSNAESLTITVVYEGETYDNLFGGDISASLSESNQSIRVNINKKFSKIQINKNIEFDITCTEPLTHFAYIVVTRGMIIKSSYVSVHRKKKHTLRLKMTPEMSPEARLVVYYTNRDYILIDDVVLKFDKFNNDFKVTLDENEYFPGQDIALEVYAADDSYVAFSAIDQSVLLVGRERHDFFRNDVLLDLAEYGKTEPSVDDLIHTWGLFSRSTAKIDTVTSRGAMSRFYRPNRRVSTPVHIRTQFMESWLWQNFTMKTSTRTIRETVPDTITTYFVSGFALSPTKGLAVFRQPLQLTVKQSFYLVAHLPYSIKRDEVLAVQVTVFNFLNHDLTTQVSLFNNREQLEFVDKSSVDPKRRYKSVIARANKGTSVSFMVKAKKIGLIPIKLQAVNQLASDAIEHMLQVTPESHPYFGVVSRFIQVKDYNSEEYNLTLNVPKIIDEGSLKVYFALDPDIIGTAVSNLEGLIRLPTGSGEQNMLHFVPNIVVLDYLHETNTLSEDVESKAIDYLTKGLQNQLRYQNSDGSFSLWENSDNSSTFLTAFVAKSLKMASKYIEVDKEIVSSAFGWLVSKQSPDGQFPEVGTIFNKEWQGGITSTSSRFALTAYVLVALAEDQEIREKYKVNIDLTADYLRKNFNIIEDEYDLSLITYGFFLINDRDKQKFLDKFVPTAIYDDETVERYWGNKPVHIETTGYALLTYILKDMLVDATPIMRWLSSQRYDLGGFAGTQDTFVGLKALAAFAAKATPEKNNYRVTIYNNNNKILQKFDVDSSNKFETPTAEIFDTSHKLRVTVDGYGYGIMQLNYTYHQNVLDHIKPAFDLNLAVLKTTTDHVQHLKVCVAFKQKGSTENSGMALVEVFLPSGFTVGIDAVQDITRRIRKVERRFGGTSLVVYFDYLSPVKDCFIVTANRQFQIALHLPSYVKVYEYNNRDNFAIGKYDGKVMQLCDICGDMDCDNLSC